MANFSIMADVPNPVFDSNGNPFSGAVLKAFLPGTTTSTSIAIDEDGGSPQASITYNAQGKLEVTGNEILPYIDRKIKWGIFANAVDAAANTPFYMGPFDDVPRPFDNNSAARLNPATLAIWQADTSAQADDVLNIKERSAGNGNQFFADVITGTGTANGNDIVAHSTLNLSAVMRDLDVERNPGTVAIMVATDWIPGQNVTTRGYFVSGSRGAATYAIKTAAQATTDGDIIDELGGHTLANGFVATIQTIKDKRNIAQYGAVGVSTGNPTVDVLPSINAALFGGGTKVKIPGLKYGIINTVKIPSDSELVQVAGGKLFGLGIMSPLECMVTPDVDTSNIKTKDLFLDANNELGLSCLFVRLGSNNVKCTGTTAVNTTHDLTRGGGRGLSVHGGAPNGNRNIILDNSTVIDCYEAIDVVADDTLGNTSKNVMISNTTVENCEILIALFTSTAAFPISPDFHNVVIDGVVGRNVGRSDTFTRVHGVINSKEGGNTLISNVFVHNDAAYTAVKAVYAVMGKMSNVKISNFVYSGAMSYVYNNRAWDESNPSISNDNISRDLDFDINVVGTAFSPISSALTAGSLATLIRSTFKAKANAWTQTNVFDFAVDKYVTVYSEIMETTTPRRLTGIMSSMNSLPFTVTGADNVANIGGAIFVVDTVDGKTYRQTLANGVPGAFVALN